MQTIVVRYLEVITSRDGVPGTSVLLGTEIYENIKEVLIPGIPQPKGDRALHPVFFTKCFLGIDNHLWRVESVAATPADAQQPAFFSVLIKRHDVSKEIFLYQTLKSNKGLTAQKILGQQGTLVEVDYGFVQRAGRMNAISKTNKRYMDTLLEAEMHKRRLAVVVKVISANLIQVAPVTSREIKPGDRTAFKLDRSTLEKMPRYQNSGKESYVICSMLECVSVQRILPPVSYFKEGRSSGRNANYGIALSRSESKKLKNALIHAIGAGDHVPYNDVLQSQRQVDQLQASVESLTAQLKAQAQRLNHLSAVERLAKSWAESMGRDYEDELEFQCALDAENGL